MIEPRPEVLVLPPYRPGRPEGLPPSSPMVNLAANENAWGPSSAAAERMADVVLQRYPDMAGQALLQRLSRSWGLCAQQVVLGTGSGHLIKLLAEAYLRPGDRVVTTFPTFSLYASDSRLMGAEVRALPGDGHGVDFSRLPQFVREAQPRLVFACSPNNPTGDRMDAQTLAALLDAIAPDGLLVLDEAYVHFASDAPDALAHVRAGSPIAVLRTFSKVYGLAALRLGALAAPAEVASAVSRVREPFPASATALAAAEAAVDDAAHVADVVARTRRGRDTLTDGLGARGFPVRPSHGNFVWAQVPGHLPADGLVSLLRQEGVLVRSGSAFGATSHIRVSVGTPAEVDRFFDALDRTRGDRLGTGD